MNGVVRWSRAPLDWSAATTSSHRHKISLTPSRQQLDKGREKVFEGLAPEEPSREDFLFPDIQGFFFFFLS